jgi:pantoate--beta-alanine ligase
MRVLTSIDEMRHACKTLHQMQTPKTLGLVPTMGAIHEGHLSLVRAARRSCDHVAASIFVNPAQFGPHEDFAQYPRTFQADCDLLEREGVDLLFAPSASAMYPPGEETWVDVPGVGSRLDGASRPGHFRGVATVVTKLFNIVQPDKAFFGQKDAAQVAVLRSMVKALNSAVEIVVCPTVRDADGLALSSRNRSLTADARKSALALSRSLRRLETAVAQGQVAAPLLRNTLLEELKHIQVDYAEIVDPDTLLQLDYVSCGALIAVAAWVDGTRLIDNLLIPRSHAH